ncbi:helix-turn-helix domain-containing protein [Halorussus ruber]|uniref:hypothetical protein n=1 Tax=Halorussus ruber TaxID=1126238 RepID=UPI0010932F25|nr:hypothetical protein [Halorussus ruber]
MNWGSDFGDCFVDSDSDGDRLDTGRAVVTDGGKHSPESLNERFSDEDEEKIRLIVQETRLNLIQDILAHPWMSPSLQEFDDYNPSRSKGTLSGHLKKLVEGGILLRVTLPQGEQKRDRPSTFYTLSDAGYELLDRHELLLPRQEELRAELARTEKTQELVELENAPRPTIDVEYDHPLQGDEGAVVNPAEITEGQDGTTYDTDDGDSNDNGKTNRDGSNPV